MKKLDKAILSFVDKHYIICGITGQLIAVMTIIVLSEVFSYEKVRPITLPILIVQIIAAIYLGRVVVKYIKNA